MSEIVIIGGGLAGCLIARACLDRGVVPALWVEAPAVPRASDVPCALVHPFVGRSFQPHPQLEQAWQASRAFIASLPADACVHRAPLRRWIEDGRGGARLWSSWSRHREALEGWVSMRAHTTGRRWIEYGPTFGFDMGAAVLGMRASMAKRGLHCHGATVTAVRPEGRGWGVEFDTMSSASAEHVFVAAGRGTASLVSPWGGSERSIGEVEGSLVYGAGAPLTRFHVDGGHLSSTTKTIAWGSSYRRLAEPSARSTADQLAEIHGRLEASIPPMSCVSRWTGVRVVDERRRTVWAATLAPGLHVLGAMGSKGALWGPWLAKKLAASVVG